jgi:glycosyltransferase involved in cell wall biosynthesis
MRILIDGGCWTNGRGYGRFTRELLAALARAPSHEYIVLLEEQARRDFALPLQAAFVELSQPVGQGATSSGRRSIRDVLAISRAAARERADAVFFPSVYSYFPLRPRSRGLVGVHDTMADRFPQFAFDSSAQERFWRWKMRLALAQCHDILTVSQYSRRSIESHWSIPSNRIHVIQEGPSPIFRPLDVPKRKVVLTVGGISPNKNLASLIRAFEKVRSGFELVIAGDYESDRFKTCYAELAQLAEGKPVRFTGRVSDEELWHLYNEAMVLAFPSLEEGFGLPAVEAMACGLPVVAHDGHASAEIVDNAGVLVNATDENELAAGLNRVLDNPSLAAELRIKGMQRAAQYSWDRAAKQLENVFESIWN